MSVTLGKKTVTGLTISATKSIQVHAVAVQSSRGLQSKGICPSTGFHSKRKRPSLKVPPPTRPLKKSYIQKGSVQVQFFKRALNQGIPPSSHAKICRKFREPKIKEILPSSGSRPIPKTEKNVLRPRRLSCAKKSP